MQRLLFAVQYSHCGVVHCSSGGEGGEFGAEDSASLQRPPLAWQRRQRLAAPMEQAGAGRPTALQFLLLSILYPWAHSLQVLSLPQVLHNLVFGHCTCVAASAGWSWC